MADVERCALPVVRGTVRSAASTAIARAGTRAGQLTIDYDQPWSSAVSIPAAAGADAGAPRPILLDSITLFRSVCAMTTRRAAACTATSLLLALCALLPAADTVAVWDPVTKVDNLRFSVDPARSAEVAAWAATEGRTVTLLTSAQIQAGALDPATVDVLVVPGDVVPRGDLPALKRFIDGGGVPVLLGARVPWITAIAPAGGQSWDLSPSEPRFAWQTTELQAFFGIKYVYAPALHDAGVEHRPTALLTRYLPAAATMAKQLPSYWLQTQDAGEFIPLFAATRIDGMATVPSLYVLKRKQRQAVVCAVADLTSGPQPWCAVAGRPLVQALVALACDLHTGKADLATAERTSLTADPKPLEPLLSRQPEGQVEPDGATPLIRWGRFDGSGRELGGAGTLPRRLDPGASVELPVAALPAGPRWLRVRLAFCAGGAGLQLGVGETVIMDERFVYHNAQGESNNTKNPWADVPDEVQRVVAMPPGEVRVVRLRNPGSQPIWFDAAQIEGPTGRSSPVLIGFQAGFESTLTQAARDRSTDPNVGKSWTFDPALATTWSDVRIDARLHLVGPPEDPQRWAQSDELMANYRRYGRPLNVIFGSCPQWLATPSSYAEAVSRKRAHICVPRADLWPGFLGEWIKRYGDQVAGYEVGNEVDIKQFWIGTTGEWRTFWDQTRDVVRQLAPGKQLITPGLAAQGPEWIQTMIDSGAFRDAQYVPIHCYAGQTVSWDLVHGKFEGFLMAKGVQTPIFANEQGFPAKNFEWFVDSWTPAKQADAVECATARLYAAAQPRITLFHAGGGRHGYGVIDEHGVPLPAYQRYAMYLALNGPGAQRLDTSLTTADGSALTGTYVAGAAQADGAVTVVVNPCESPAPVLPLTRLGLWLPDVRPRVVAAPPDGVTIHQQQGAWVQLDLPAGSRRSLRLVVP